MSPVFRFSPFRFSSVLLLTLVLAGCHSTPPPPPRPTPGVANRGPATILLPLPVTAAPRPSSTLPFPVMLGIDVLQAEGFVAVKGKRLGLLTHPAGVNRLGVSSIEILRRAPGVKLAALFAVEHGLYGEIPAEKTFPDKVDPRTGLPVFSLYNGQTKKFVPTRAQLQGIDALVIDLQDIGSRSYTYIGAMKSAMEACFAEGKEVIVLDRPNPLGGLKVDGPPLDAEWMSDVGRFRVPYVHGLTMGELALLARDLPAPDGLAVSNATRAGGRLTVIPMQGWRRAMRWPETGLNFVPTSPNIRDFETCEAYPMTGLGCLFGGFRNGIGGEYIFRGISHATASPEVVERELRALSVTGLEFRRITVPATKGGRPATAGSLITLADFAAWQPTELSLRLMKLSCKLDRKNPFAKLTAAQKRTFLIHLGSTAFYQDLQAKGGQVDIDRWLALWRQQAANFQGQSKKYWLYR